MGWNQPSTYATAKLDENKKKKKKNATAAKPSYGAGLGSGQNTSVPSKSVKDNFAARQAAKERQDSINAALKSATNIPTDTKKISDKYEGTTPQLTRFNERRNSLIPGGDTPQIKNPLPMTTGHPKENKTFWNTIAAANAKRAEAGANANLARKKIRDKMFPPELFPNRNKTYGAGLGSGQNTANTAATNVAAENAKRAVASQNNAAHYDPVSKRTIDQPGAGILRDMYSNANGAQPIANAMLDRIEGSAANNEASDPALFPEQRDAIFAEAASRKNQRDFDSSAQEQGNQFRNEWDRYLSDYEVLAKEDVKKQGFDPNSPEISALIQEWVNEERSDAEKSIADFDTLLDEHRQYLKFKGQILEENKKKFEDEITSVADEARKDTRRPGQYSPMYGVQTESPYDSMSDEDVYRMKVERPEEIEVLNEAIKSESPFDIKLAADKRVGLSSSAFSAKKPYMESGLTTRDIYDLFHGYEPEIKDPSFSLRYMDDNYGSDWLDRLKKGDIELDFIDRVALDRGTDEAKEQTASEAISQGRDNALLTMYALVDDVGNALKDSSEDKAYVQTKNLTEKYNYAIANSTNFNPDKWIETISNPAWRIMLQGVSGVSNQLTMYTKFGPKMAVGGILGGMVGGVKGAQVGAQLLTFEDMVDIETNLSYVQNVEKGLNHKEALSAARATGVINGLIENVQLAMLIRGVPIGKVATMVAGKFGTGAAAKFLTGSGRVAAATLSESGEEGMQQIVQDVASNLAIDAHNDDLSKDATRLEKMTFLEVMADAKDAFVKSLPTMGIMGFPSAVMGAGAENKSEFNKAVKSQMQDVLLRSQKIDSALGAHKVASVSGLRNSEEYKELIQIAQDRAWVRANMTDEQMSESLYPNVAKLETQTYDVVRDLFLKATMNVPFEELNATEKVIYSEPGILTQNEIRYFGKSTDANSGKADINIEDEINGKSETSDGQTPSIDLQSSRVESIPMSVADKDEWNEQSEANGYTASAAIDDGNLYVMTSDSDNAIVSYAIPTEGVAADEIIEAFPEEQRAAVEPVIRAAMPEVHTPEQQRVIEEYEGAVDQRILDFIQIVRENPDDNWRKLDMGKVPEAQVSIIKQLTGLDVSGYDVEIQADAIKHIDRRHGENGEADSSMADANDIARILYVVSNPDKAAVVDKSAKFKNSDGSRADVVLETKRIDGYYYVAETVPDSTSKKLYVTSAYQNKNDTSLSSADFWVSPLLLTSENGLELTGVVTDNIAQESETVKDENKSPVIHKTKCPV
jgi:hypothetical protein